MLRNFAEKMSCESYIFQQTDGFLTKDFILMVKKSCMHMIIRRTESLMLMTSIFLADIIMRMSWCACAMSVSIGVPMDKIVEVLKTFKAVEHRIEYVTEKRGVRFYNDSKGTKPGSRNTGNTCK